MGTRLHYNGKHMTDQRKDDPKHRISLLTLHSKIFSSKIFENLLIKLLKLLEYLKHLIPEAQFGFMTSLSCTKQLLRVTDIILGTFGEKKVCLGLFIVTEKGFDNLRHDGLLYKIKPHLFTGHILPTNAILTFKQDVLGGILKLTVYFPPY